MGANRLFLGYETAFWIWRKVGPLAPTELLPTRVRSLMGGAPSQAKLELFRSEHPDLVLDAVDVLVRPGDQRRVPGTNVHVISRDLPDRSFCRLDDDLYVASPELTLFQLASKLSEAQALKLAMEMCGGYAIDTSTAAFYDHDPFSSEGEDVGICKRPPLTNARKLSAYAARLYRPDSRAHGVKFLRWLVDGSASPRETALCMLLCMPPRLGGYGLALPELNKRIELTLEERIMVGVQHFDCDLCWLRNKKSVALEYDSKLYHTAEEKQERDAIRRNMLQYKGVRVITATRVQVNRPEQFDKLAKQVARAVGKRMRTVGKEHIAARDDLRETLFSWDVLAEARPEEE